MEDEELNYFPGLDDDESVPRDIRIERYAAYLREWSDFDLAIKLAATNSIMMRDFERKLDLFDNEIEPLKNLHDRVKITFDLAKVGIRIGRESSEKLRQVLKRDIDRREKLAVSGERGANSRKEKFAPVKEWALNEAKKMRGSDREIARKLAASVPQNIPNPSGDTERLIYDAIRASKKTRS